MPDKKFDLGDYVEVKDRIRIFYELFGQGRLVTRKVTLTSEPDGKPRVIVSARAYRTPDDPHPGTGTSWMELPGTTPYTRGSEVENAETSAWGRAIASLGILIDRSIASAQEVDGKRAADPDPARVDQTTGEIHDAPFEATVEGRVAFGRSAPSDGNYRQTPEGLAYGFVVEAEGGKRLQVLVTHLAEALQLAGAPVKGTWVTVEGLIERIGWTKDGKDMPPYQRMALSRLTTPDYTLPAPKPLPAEDMAELDALEVPWPDVVERSPA